ncbi:MAG TPA: DJ-1/PfpI family protein [Kofleriaceae bacterium]
MTIAALLLFPELTQLDLTGPYEVLARIPGMTCELVAKTRAPVASEFGLVIVPTATFADVTSADLLFVPGGRGISGAIEDAETLAWVRALGASARWITSACTGALVLGAAGLLDGYRAATHWLSMELLPIVGAIPTDARVVRDRNRITSGGVTAGIDLALDIAAELAGPSVAERIALNVEYDPAPRWPGHPRSAAHERVDELRRAMAERQAARRALLERHR